MDLRSKLAEESDAEAVMQCTNDAFMADTFFKKPEFHLRFTLEEVMGRIREENSGFLLALLNSNGGCNDDNACAQQSGGQKIVGSVHLHWNVEENINEIDRKKVLVGKFSAMSVPPQYEKKGIGKFLVRSMEEYLLQLARQECVDSVILKMGVINARTDLFTWYEKQGFVTGSALPRDEELQRIVLDNLNICCVEMWKILSIP